MREPKPSGNVGCSQRLPLISAMMLGVIKRIDGLFDIARAIRGLPLANAKYVDANSLRAVDELRDCFRPSEQSSRCHPVAAVVD